MKSPLHRSCAASLLLSLLLPVSGWSQVDDIEIAGAEVSGARAEVMLIQKSTGSGRWVKIGQSFAGYKVGSYDDKTGRLTLTKDGASHVLILKKATVQTTETAGAPGTPPSPEQQKGILNNLRQISAAADQYFLEQGVNTVEISRLVGTEPNKYIKAIKPLAGESYSGMVIEQGKPLRVTTATGFKVEYKN